MSQTKTYPIACPKCGLEQDAELYDAVNVAEDPELREALLRNELNQVACEGCEFSFRVDKPLLYHDADAAVMIYWLAVQDDHAELAEEEFRQSVSALNQAMPEDVRVPDIHLVLHRAELVERIFLVEADLDERVVEYIKYTIYSQNMSRLPAREKRLLFNAEDSNDETLYLVVQDVASRQLEGMLEYQREAYEALCDLFDRDDHTPSLLELFPGPYISARALMMRQEQE